jgi:hypothetical protein
MMVSVVYVGVRAVLYIGLFCLMSDSTMISISTRERKRFTEKLSSTLLGVGKNSLKPNDFVILSLLKMNSSWIFVAL